MSQVRPIDELFGELIQLETAEQREQFLDEIGSKDMELRAQLERLAESHLQAGSFLADGSEPDITVDQSSGKLIGTTVGPYKLLQPVGEGGMGTVYLAERQKPVRQRVALKMIDKSRNSGNDATIEQPRSMVARWFEAFMRTLPPTTCVPPLA